MMEVTPHLKSVLKNYQHSATKSLQGPGLALVTAKCEPSSPDFKEDCDFLQPTPFPIQQLPILTTPDTSCSERTETVLEGESISCFVVGGEKRLCLPQVLNSVLGEFSLMQINQECDQLQIYCSRCTPEQLNVLKNQGILPSSAPSCGLITKTDAERLCSALLHNQVSITVRPHKGAITFSVYHECFGKCKGICTPALFTSKDARCIECLECHGAYTPQQFVCHVHRNLENRTVHWGFDSTLWRSYLYICKDQLDHEQYGKYLDEMRDQFEGKIAFPVPVIDSSLSSLKRKQIHHHGSDVLKIELAEIPHKRNKIDEFNQLSYNMNMQQQLHQIYATIDPMYIQYIHEQCLNPTRQISAFKPFGHVLKDTKIRHTMGYSDPPVLQHPERVIPLSQTERFEGTFQPNVALAPPKKHRYMHIKQENVKMENKESPPSNEVTSTKEHINANSMSVIRHEKYLEHFEQDRHSPKVSKQKSPDSQNVIDSTVSVVQSTGNMTVYNSEIELSTDTDDSGSEILEKSDLFKIEEATKDVECSVRQRILLIVRNMRKEHEVMVQDNRNKDNKINELSNRIAELERHIKSLRDLHNSTNSSPLRNGFLNEDTHSTTDVEDRTQSPSLDKASLISTSGENQTSAIDKRDEHNIIINEDGASSSNVVTTEEVEKNKTAYVQSSILCSLESTIIKTAPE